MYVVKTMIYRSFIGYNLLDEGEKDVIKRVNIMFFKPILFTRNIKVICLNFSLSVSNLFVAAVQLYVCACRLWMFDFAATAQIRS